ncbi:flagellar biosynthesis anti-sigma factor FlgM [Rhodocyclaceae bacterium SMB388]
MKIEGGVKSVGNPLAGENRSRAQSNPPQQPGAEAKVELSALSASLSKADAAIASTPVVDQARVDEIRLAISEGRFQVDAKRVADGLIDSVRDMLDRRS